MNIEQHSLLHFKARNGNERRSMFMLDIYLRRSISIETQLRPETWSLREFFNLRREICRTKIILSEKPGRKGARAGNCDQIGVFSIHKLGALCSKIRVNLVTPEPVELERRHNQSRKKQRDGIFRTRKKVLVVQVFGNLARIRTIWNASLDR